MQNYNLQHTVCNISLADTFSSVRYRYGRKFSEYFKDWKKSASKKASLASGEVFLKGNVTAAPSFQHIV